MNRSLIFAAMIAFTLTACGREEAPKTTPPPPPAAATPPPATPPADKPADKPAGAAEAPKPEEKKQ